MTRAIALLALALAAGGARADEASPADYTAVSISVPAEQHPGCFADSMRIPRDLAGRLPERADIRFTVSRTGAVQDVRVDGLAHGALATQVKGGLSRCGWTPAADAAGVPVTVAVLMPVRFERGREAALAAAARAGPARLALAAR